jgi:hypothetical protein
MNWINTDVLGSILSLPVTRRICSLSCLTVDIAAYKHFDHQVVTTTWAIKLNQSFGVISGTIDWMYL